MGSAAYAGLSLSPGVRCSTLLESWGRWGVGEWCYTTRPQPPLALLKGSQKASFLTSGPPSRRPRVVLHNSRAPGAVARSGVTTPLRASTSAVAPYGHR
eukprot:gene12236-biopygen5679